MDMAATLDMSGNPPTQSELDAHSEAPLSSEAIDEVISTGDVERARFAEYVRRESLIQQGCPEFDRRIIKHGPHDARYDRRVFRPHPALWVDLMDRRGQRPILLLIGWGRTINKGPIDWQEQIMIFEDRPYDHKLDCAFWMVRCGEYGDEICNYLFSVGRIVPGGADPALRPPLK